jgi:hypothetical protein
MKQKAKIGAIITLIVAGLLITSAAGIRPTSLSVSEPKQTTPAERVDIATIIDIIKNHPELLDQFETVGVQHDISAKAFQPKMAQAEAQQAWVVASQDGAYELVNKPDTSGGLRQDYESKPRHPAIASDGGGNIILLNDYYYFNYTTFE